MSINGIGPTTYTPAPQSRAADRPQPQPQAVAKAEVQVPAAAASKPEPLAAAAPEGVDPTLWSVLTTEERAYFSRVRSLGPLTYGPNPTPARPALRGGRIDVTV